MPQHAWLTLFTWPTDRPAAKCELRWVEKNQPHFLAPWAAHNFGVRGARQVRSTYKHVYIVLLLLQMIVVVKSRRQWKVLIHRSLKEIGCCLPPPAYPEMLIVVVESEIYSLMEVACVIGRFLSKKQTPRNSCIWVLSISAKFGYFAACLFRGIRRISCKTMFTRGLF